MAKQRNGTPGVFGFDSALIIMKAGGRVRRTSWGHYGDWVSVKIDHVSERQTMLSIQRQTSDGFEVPYNPSSTDILSTDWTAEHIGDMLMAKDA